MRLIPAIDIIEGKCVRLTKGDYSTQKIYNENPLEVAKQFEGHGIDHLHLVDLDGAKSKHIVNYKVLEQIASKTSLQIDFGGGLKSDTDVQIAFENGAQQITGGSIAVTEPETFLGWLQRYGAEKIILGADVRNGTIATHGWKETSDKKLIPFLQQYVAKGIRYCICTDISKDGMLEGPAIDLYGHILSEMKREEKTLNLIASGGVSSLQDLSELAEIGCEGAILGKAVYENRISLSELETFILQNKS
ncbi:1-(5-phosphoribosyl)-5-[(5-phosphoribosylamino)methylideneamino]imidazole-4-carboxamide isomerase [Luteirhabdus pelagi]|uniref:1-(5-phosphoribosyl)-5-[(5- phosphoribosylamino)methylideneamino]imidazole-4- carboxamide isomerase n=1 Tax=Luteirhabdus pelagi TaxID=2792783 RepID=UPI00193A7A31|nr:1-(5-phosphoribosyl)-5-[(5-phosphoribosylamino)methylideneamino]imidazole-4-carboxamide isomerase [Luteirhabdus pelagi]